MISTRGIGLLGVFAVLASLLHAAGACDAGYYLSAGNCVGCPAGTFSKAGAARCSACPAGSTGNSSGSRSYCTCPAGFYFDTTADLCGICSPGYYSSSSSTMCTACSTGTTSSYGASMCTTIQCPSGKYLNGNTCESCPTGYSLNPATNTCTLTPTGGMTRKRSLTCHRGLTKCPRYSGVAGFECVNIGRDTESCGGCVVPEGVPDRTSFGEETMPIGRDCTAIPNADVVFCKRGRCSIEHCHTGFVKAQDSAGQDICTPSPSARHKAYAAGTLLRIHT